MPGLEKKMEAPARKGKPYLSKRGVTPVKTRGRRLSLKFVWRFCMDLALKCLFCGEDLKEGWVSCPSCGNKVVDLNDAVEQGTATVSSNGKFIAVISGGEIHVRNTESMELVDSLSRAYKTTVPAGFLGVRQAEAKYHSVLAISNDGCHLVASSNKKYVIEGVLVLDVKTNQKLEMYLKDETRNWVSINPDESLCITCKDGKITFWKREQ